MADAKASSSHWGEIEELSPNIPGHHIELTELKPAEYEIPRLHQPSAENYPPKDELPSKYLASVKPPLDKHSQNLVLHSIELQHHKRRMRLVLMAAQHQYGEAMKSEGQDLPALPPHPPKPSRFCSSQGIVTPQTQSTLFERLHAQPRHVANDSHPLLVHPQLDSVSNRQLLFRAVASMCTHSGFEMASESALQTLTDILHDFSTRFCKLLRTAVDNEAMNGRTGFPDAMDCALHEIGLGGTAAIQKYWMNGIQEFALRLQQEDRQLIQDYQLITDPSVRVSFSGEEDNSGLLPNVKVKEEPIESKYLSSLRYRSYSTGEQNPDFPSLSSPNGTLPSNGTGGTSEVNSDPNSPHWNINYKTEPVDESYDDPMAVVPATPQSG